MHPAYTDHITQNKCLKTPCVFPRNLQNSLNFPLPLFPIAHPNFRAVIMDKVHTSPSKTIARDFFTTKYFCLFECAGHQSEGSAQSEELKMEKTIYRRSPSCGLDMSGWKWRKMSQSRSNTVASGGPAAGDGGQESIRSQGVRIPLIPSQTRALQCRAPQNKRQILQPNFRLPVEKD